MTPAGGAKLGRPSDADLGCGLCTSDVSPWFCCQPHLPAWRGVLAHPEVKTRYRTAFQVLPRDRATIAQIRFTEHRSHHKVTDTHTRSVHLPCLRDQLTSPSAEQSCTLQHNARLRVSNPGAHIRRKGKQNKPSCRSSSFSSPSPYDMSVKGRDDMAEAEAVSTRISSDAAIERTVVRKLDRNFLLLLWFLCMFFAGSMMMRSTLLIPVVL